MYHVIFAYVVDFCQSVQIDIFFIMSIYVAVDRDAQAAGFALDRSKCGGIIRLTCQMDDKNFHQILSDDFMSRSFGGDFSQQILQIKEKGFFFVFEADNTELVV